MSKARIIDGKAVAARVREQVACEVTAFKEQRGYAPTLATVLVGGDPASQVYVGNKKKACAEVGIESVGHELAADAGQAQLEELVRSLNEDQSVNGILVQLPLRDGLDATAVLDLIDPDKDVDGLTTVNAGKLVQSLDCLVPCTPLGVIELLAAEGTRLDGANVVVVGRSNLVGRPLISLLLHRNATVTVCHSHTRDLAVVTSKADILIAAVGRPGFITAEMVKTAATVIDVGISRTEDGLVGDVDFDPVSQIAAAITPVPGGVGPMTIAMLLKNTLQAAGMSSEARKLRHSSCRRPPFGV